MTRLRGPLSPADVDALLEPALQWVNDPDVMKNFARFEKAVTREEERAYLAQLYASPNDRVFAIENDAGEYIGQVGVHQIYWPARHGRLGIVIGRKDEWGRGHAQRAIAQLIEIAFGSLGLHKLWAIFYESNERMRHITEKLGFVREGLLLDEYFHGGRYHDMVRVAKLASLTSS